LQRNGTLIANRENRTRRVDKGKSGQAQKTAVSGGFGGGILSQLLKTSGDSFGGTDQRLSRSRRAIITVVLVDVLTGLGGASQEKSAPRNFLPSAGPPLKEKEQNPFPTELRLRYSEGNGFFL
jgi:hypothetical protein